MIIHHETETQVYLFQDYRLRRLEIGHLHDKGVVSKITNIHSSITAGIMDSSYRSIGLIFRNNTECCITNNSSITSQTSDPSLFRFEAEAFKIKGLASSSRASITTRSAAR